MGLIQTKIRESLFKNKGETFCKKFSFWNKYHYNYPFKVTSVISQSGHSYKVSEKDKSIHIARNKRLYIYKNGITARLKKLSEWYFIPKVSFNKGDTVIDCGANIGEIGMYLKSQQKDINYIAIEPSDEEADACDLNNYSNQCNTIRKALWNQNGTTSFYHKNDSGDSSVFETNDFSQVKKVTTITLDKLCDDLGITSIKWFKLEAEGAEPEILLGAKNILKNIEYISVDCGYERGKSEDHTVCEVINHLTSHNFELIEMRFDRIICLFRNKKTTKNVS